MASSTTASDELFLSLAVGVTGADSLKAIQNLVAQLGSEVKLLGTESGTTSSFLKILQQKMLDTAQSMKAGSAEAVGLTRAAVQLQQQINALTRAEKEAAAAAEQNRAQAGTNTHISQLGSLAEQATSGIKTLRAGLMALVAGQIAQEIKAIAAGMRELADEANRSRTSGQVFALTMQTYKVNLEEANAVAERVAKRFSTNVIDVKASMTDLVRAGFTNMKALEETMTGAGASMVAKTGQLGDAFGRLADAARSGLSQGLNSIGVSANYGPALDKYAKSLHTTADALTDIQRAEVLHRLILKETGTEVQALDLVMNDYTRSQSDAQKATSDLRKEIGNDLIPVMQYLNTTSAEAIKAALDWAKAHREDLREALRITTTGIVDTVSAAKVLIATAADLGVAAGNIATIIVGLGLTIAGGLQSGIETGIGQIKLIFKTALEDLTAFQKAWELLKKGDFKGAWSTLQTARDNTIGVIKNAPGNIWNGAQQGAAFGLDVMGTGASGLVNFGQRIQNAAQQGQLDQQKVTNALDGFTAGAELINALGMVGKKEGAKFGQTYGPGGSWGKHVGEDFFADVGTPVKAGFTGYVQLRQDKAQGNIVDLFDALGQRLTMIHLQKYADGLVEAVKAAGGRLLVQQGTWLGSVGQTGTAAHAELGPQNAHLHIHAMVNGTLVDPLAVKFKGVDSTGGWMPTPGDQPANTTPPPTDDKDAKKRAENRLKTQQALTKALLDGQEAEARALIQKLKDQQAAELALAQNSAQKRAQIVSQSGPAIIAAEDKLAALQRDRAVKAANDAAQEARKLPGADLGAVEATRKAAIQKAYFDEATARQAARTAQQKAENAADQDALRAQQQHDKERKALLHQNAEEARALQVSAAQQTLDRLKTLDERALNSFKGTAAQRLDLIKRQSQDEYAAAAAVAKAKEQVALQQSANQGGPNQGERDRQIKAEYDQTILTLKGARLSAVKAAQQAVTEEMQRAADEAYVQTFQSAQAVATARYGNGQAVMDAVIRQSYGVGDAGLIRSLADLTGKTVTQVRGDVNGALAELATYNQAAADSIQRVYGSALEHRRLYLDADEAGQTALQDMISGYDELGNVIYKTDAELRGIGQAAQDSAEDFFNLDTAIQNVLTLPWAEVNALLTASKLKPDQVEAITQAWRDFHQEGAAMAAQDEFLAPVAQQLQDAYDQINAGTLTGQQAKDMLADLRARLEGISGPVAERLIAVLDGINQRIDDSIVNLREMQNLEAADQQLGGIATRLQDAYDQINAGTLNGQQATDVLVGLREELVALGGPAAQNLIEVLDELIQRLEETKTNLRDVANVATLDAQVGPLAERLQGVFDALSDGKITSDQARAVFAALREELSGINTEEAQNLAKAIDQITGGLDQLKDIQRQVAQAGGEVERPFQGLLDQLEELRKKPGAAVAEIDALIKKLRELQGQAEEKAAWEKSLDKFNLYAGYVQKLASAFGQLAEATGNSDLAANLTGLGNLAGKAVGLVQSVMQGYAQGGWVGAAVAGVASLTSIVADAISGFQKAKKEAEDARKAFQDSFKIIDAGAFSTFGTRSRGFLADLFGGGPEVIQQINQQAADIARTIESGVSGAFSNGIKRFLNGEGSMLEALRSGIRDTIVDAITQAVVQGAVIKGALGTMLTNLTTTLANGGDPTAIIAQIGAALPGVASTLGNTLAPLLAALNSALGANTAATLQNTQAVKESQFQNTTIVQYGQTGTSGRLRNRLAGI